MGMACGVITETWLSDGEGLEEDLEDLVLGAGMGMLCLNRPKNSKGFPTEGLPWCTVLT